MITIRNLDFGARSAGIRRWYLGGNPVASAFFNALSLTFPAGERYFIDSVRAFLPGLPSKLKGEARDFVTQEALHTREHAAFNDHVEAAGYEVRPMVARAERELTISKDASPTYRLAVTISLEHLTALYANQVLSCSELFEEAPPSIRQLWRWHAIEEIEHKAVAFDVFMWATRDWSAVRRYFFRCAVMAETSLRFAKVISFNIRDFYRQDGIAGLGMIWRTLAYFLGPRGTAWRLGGGWLRWFRPGFHPWDHDDSELARIAAADLNIGPA